MKVIVSGIKFASKVAGDYFNDYQMLQEVIKASGFSPREIIIDCEQGVGRLAARYAEENKLKLHRLLVRKRFYRTWQTAYSKCIVEMCNFADALIAVWDGVSVGVKELINYARERGLLIYVHLFKKPV